MSRTEFMDRLSYLLQDLSKEEQEDALQYYEDYFDDAGVFNENNVINELGSPEKVAAIIRDDLKNIDGIKDSGEFTENGYKDPLYNENHYEVATKNATKDTEKEKQSKAEKSVDDYFDNDYFNPNYKHNTEWNESTSEKYQGGAYQNPNYNNQGYDNSGYHNDKYQSTYENYDKNYDYNRNKNRNLSNWSPILIIIVAVITSPIWISIVCVGIGILLGLAGLAIGVIAALVASLVGFFCSALGCAVLGIIRLFTRPIVGIFLIGVALVLFALGLLFLVLNIWFFRIGLPKCVQFIGNICKAPFNRRKAA